ncbi:hypothetical protein UFOVP215_10 [uncultured Caudovirales phage]|uniref:Uncharacterized protein n=1 Tax=uncultured Caudovirales phage TaxID=2100421 RepID=A0A6J7WU84_9CAUD|nr:hypothetical protein UFOVP215_10 [uncultured Caudovirales phage]
MLPQIGAGLTKNQIKIIAQNSVNELLENGRILEAAEALSIMEKFIEEVRGSKAFTDFVRDEIAKNGKEIINSSGAKLELSEVGIKYDFSQCNDPILIQLEARFGGAKAMLDERKKYLKAIPSLGVEVLIEDELVKLFPPSKSSSSTYKITLSK